MRTLVALLLLAQAHSAYAEQGYWLSGNTLKVKCESDYIWEQALCTGFILGTIDRTAMLSEADATLARICISNGATRGQLQDVVEEYLRENPANLHYAAVSLVTRALQEAFPCQ